MAGETKSFAGVFNAIAESIQRLDGGGDMTPAEMSVRIDGIPDRETVDNKVSSLEGPFETNDQYPSAKAVKEALDKKIDKGDGSVKTLPKYLHEISFDDTYQADAEEWYRSLSPNAFGGSCSAVVRNGKLYRNYDWTFDDTAEFVVRVSSAEGRHASVGVASLGPALTEKEAASGVYTQKVRALPGMTLDGINDAGVVAEINVDGGPKSGWHGSGVNSLHILAAVRWVLDHGETAEQAAEYIAENVRQPQGDINFHFMVADGVRTFIVENGVAQAVDDSNSVLTNFAVYDSAHSGGGKERYNLLVGGASISDVLWTNAYKPGNNWHSDFASAAEHQSAIEQWAAQGDTKEDHRGKTTAGGFAWWQTVHTSEYDFATRTMKIAVQESGEFFTFAVPEIFEESVIESENNPGYAARADYAVSAAQAGSAEEAEFDVLGNDIVETYARKDETYTQSEIDDKITRFAAHYLTTREPIEGGGYRYIPFKTHGSGSNPAPYSLAYAKKYHSDSNPLFFYAKEPFTPTKNDYCVISEDESIDETKPPTTRYSFVGEWPTGSFQYQYTINDSAFSQAQWDAINSGITSDLIQQVADELDGKQDQLSDDELTVLNGGPYLKVDSDGKVNTLQVKSSLTKGGKEVATTDQVPQIDNTLSVVGKAADAKKTGDELKTTALQNSVAEEFNSASSYKQNQVVSYNRKLYRCIEDSSAGILPTDTDHWEETTATEPVSYLSLDDHGHLSIFDAKTEERVYTDSYRINKDGKIKDAASNIVEPADGLSLVLPEKIEGYMRDFILSFTIGATVPTAFSLPPVVESPCGDSIAKDGFIKANTSYRISYSEVDEDIFELHVATSDGPGIVVSSVNGKTGEVELSAEDIGALPSTGGSVIDYSGSSLLEVGAAAVSRGRIDVWSKSVMSADPNDHASICKDGKEVATEEQVESAKSELNARIDLIEATSHPNMTIVGSPTFREGNVSGFSANDYLVFPTAVSVGRNTVEFHMAFHTGADVTTQQNLMDSWCGLAFAIRGGTTVTAISTNGSSFLAESTGGTIRANNSYRMKILFSYEDGLYRTRVYLADGAGDFSEIGTGFTADAPLFATATYWGGANPGHATHVFGGIINLNECRMLVNGVEVWRGYDELPTVKFDPTATPVLDTAEKIVGVISDAVSRDNRFLVDDTSAEIQEKGEDGEWAKDPVIRFDKGYDAKELDANATETISLDKSVQTVVTTAASLVISIPKSVGGTVREFCIYVFNQNPSSGAATAISASDSGMAVFQDENDSAKWSTECPAGGQIGIYLTEIPGQGWRAFRSVLKRAEDIA